MTRSQSGSSATSPESKQDHPESVGRYRIIRRLGEGGMGSVFLAEDTILRREVALKLPLTGTENDPEVRERFLREARSAATLDHPYICRVYDADIVDGRLYLAMAYIEGKSLADLIRAEGMPPRQVVALVGKLAIALNEAHIRGVVHRDLKPRNIMIRTVGTKREPVIVDFGLARIEGPDDVRMTRTGQIMGTPAYMAPEQLRGNPDEIGAGCDIYALGVMLYELLTGRLPFSGNYAVLVAQILTQPPLPPSTHRPGLDAGLDAICLKAMAKDVSARYASMMELATALTEYLRDAQSVSISGRSVAPISRPIEGDSIPTGADTLMSQLLKPEGNGTDQSILGINLTSAQPSRSPEPPRTPTPVAASMASAPPENPEGWKRRLPMVVASAILALFLLAGIIIVITNNGQVTIEVQDPASVAIDGQEIRVTLEGEPIVLRTGEHTLEVKWKDAHFETKKFEIKRGETTPVLITYRPKPVDSATTNKGRPIRLGTVGEDRPKIVDKKAADKSETEDSKGWVSLFNGKDLDGWKFQPGGSGNWKVEQGVIVGRGPMSFLFSERDDYANFHVRLEASCDARGGGGLVFRSSYFTEGFLKGRGHNVQISTNPNSSALMGAMAGNLIDPKFVNRVQPDEWFTMDVIAIDNHITVKINGETSLDHFDLERAYSRGHFAFRQNGGAEIRFRKIEVKEIK